MKEETAAAEGWRQIDLPPMDHQPHHCHWVEFNLLRDPTTHLLQVGQWRSQTADQDEFPLETAGI